MHFDNNGNIREHVLYLVTVVVHDKFDADIGAEQYVV